MRIDKKTIIYENGKIEYFAHIKHGHKKQTYNLHRSYESSWTNPGENVGKAIDDGNGIEINGIHYDYHVAAELLHMLQLIKLDQESRWPKVKYKEELIDNKLK